MDPSWQGRRVSVRRVVGHKPGGDAQLADVVGDLLLLDDTCAQIQTRRGQVTVPRDRIVLARLAPPSTADELALEAVAAQGWRAEHSAAVGGWVLRAAAGFSQRANSVLPLRAPGCSLEQALQTAARWYAQRDLPLRLQVPTNARRLLDAELDQRGFTASAPVQVLAGRLDMLTAGAGVPVDSVRIDHGLSSGWLAGYRGSAELSRAAQALLRRHERVAFAQVGTSAHTVAVGRGTLDGSWLGITAIQVDPARRREGLASAIMSALWRWARAQGAERSYLQVASENTSALALYRKLGYWRHHDYRYRTAPG